jgi:beta-lactamase class D
MSRLLFVLLLLPILLVSCSQNNVTVDDSLGRYFDSAGVKGSFGLFDNGQGHFTIYNLPRFRDSAYQPAATFDILLSLIALQTGVAKNETAIIFPRSSNDSGFIQLAPRIGKDTLKKWIDSLGYGNKNISGDAFWYDNHLKVTSDEQLGLIKKLYFQQLPFFQHIQKTVVSMIPSEGNANYQLHYKTAQGVKEDGEAIAWVIGWIEENKHPYFFVLNLEAPNPSGGPSTDQRLTGLGIAKKILARLGFFNGTK